MAQNEPLEDELRTLMDQVLAKATASVWADYKRHIASYNDKDNPLGLEQAQEILEKLLQKAIADRRTFNTKVERSISEGALYRRYYNKVALINDLTNDAYVKLKQMENVKDHLQYKEAVFKNVTGQMYIERVVRAVQQPSGNTPAADIGEELDRAGELLNEDEIV